jgi:hypothetical protein
MRAPRLPVEADAAAAQGAGRAEAGMSFQILQGDSLAVLRTLLMEASA